MRLRLPSKFFQSSECCRDRLVDAKPSNLVTVLSATLEPFMYIGHIYLAESMSGISETLVSLIEALDRQGVSQHVLVGSKLLGRRVAIYDSVTVGPIVKTPVMAYCLLPNVEVAHTHCSSSASAGVLLALTRSIPYVFTCRKEFATTTNPIKQSALSRASGIIFPDKQTASLNANAKSRVPVDIIADARYANEGDAHTNNRIAADHLKIYRRAVDSIRVPALLL